jgi:hypothetical protein
LNAKAENRNERFIVEKEFGEGRKEKRRRLVVQGRKMHEIWRTRSFLDIGWKGENGNRANEVFVMNIIYDIISSNKSRFNKKIEGETVCQKTLEIK